jgi:hypothetical protein
MRQTEPTRPTGARTAARRKRWPPPAHMRHLRCRGKKSTGHPTGLASAPPAHMRARLTTARAALHTWRLPSPSTIDAAEMGPEPRGRGRATTTARGLKPRKSRLVVGGGALGLVGASLATRARNVVVVPVPRPHTAPVAFVLPGPLRSPAAPFPLPLYPSWLFSYALLGGSSCCDPLAEAGRMGVRSCWSRAIPSAAVSSGCCC